MKYFFILLVLFVNEAFAVNFNKEISLDDCKNISECRQNLLLEGSWESSGFNDAQCDGFGCWNFYNQKCQEIQKKLQEKLDSISSLNVWGKEKSYLKSSYPQDVWDLISAAAQFEIDCYEIQPIRVSRLGANARVYEYCTDRAFTNCNSVNGFTKSYSSQVLYTAKVMLYKEWKKIYKAQNAYVQGDNPRNLSLLQGDFANQIYASYDEYSALVNKMYGSSFFSDDLKRIVEKEKKLLEKSKKYYDQECLMLEKASNIVLEDKGRVCTDYSLTKMNYEIFMKRMGLRKGAIEYDLWQHAVEQAKSNPHDAISSNSLIEEYLKTYPNGTYINQAKDMYEKILAQEGVEEAKRDTMLGLSDSCLLKKYLEKYPNGKFTEKILIFLESLLFKYSMSQIANDAKAAMQPNSYPEQYMKKYPNGKYYDSLSVAFEKCYLNFYSLQCASKKTKIDCEPLFIFSSKFPNSSNLDRVRNLIDEPMWASIKKNNCQFVEDSSCGEIRKYIEMISDGKYVKKAEKILAKALSNSEKKKVEALKNEERKEKAIVWFNDYENIIEGCSFFGKQGEYGFEWGDNNAFPEKNGKIECVKKNDLTLGSSDSLYKCVERRNINVRNGKIFSGQSVCENAQQETLIKRTYSNGKCKSTMVFPDQITVKENENESYSVSSKVLRLADLSFDYVIQLMSFLKAGKNFPYYYLSQFESVAFEWASSGYIKKIHIVKKYDDGKIMSTLSVPLNSKGELHGVSDVYLNSPGRFKVKWKNGHFDGFGESRIGSAELQRRLCLYHGCHGLIGELLELVNGEYVIITR